MTDVSITAANVKAGSNADIDFSHRAGASITQGQQVYLDPTTQKWKLADNNGTGTRQAQGTALNAASDDQPLAVQKGGDITMGGTLVPGTTYCVSATAGALCPQADVTSGSDVVVAGFAKTAAVLALRYFTPGVTL
jgi:hypothetical protein